MSEKLATHYVGRQGESFAHDFLEKNGYRIVQSNYRVPVGEIDFICENGNDLVFVEVKARRVTITSTPEESVTFRKQRQLYRVAEWYLNEINYRHDRPVRFGVVSILISEEGKFISAELFRNAFCL